MALGDYRFSVDTAAFGKLSRSVEYRWPSQDRAGRRPAKQFTGIGTETIEVDGVIYPHYKGGLGQMDEFRALAGEGVPYLLVDGRGKVWGKFCIESIKETRTVFFADGTPRKIEFALTLSHYGEDA